MLRAPYDADALETFQLPSSFTNVIGMLWPAADTVDVAVRGRCRWAVRR